MSEFLANFSTFLNGMIEAMGSVADFFISTTLGNIILSVALVSFVVTLILKFVK